MLLLISNSLVSFQYLAKILRWWLCLFWFAEAYCFLLFEYEQVAASTRRTTTSQIPNYPNLPYQLLCQVQNVTLHVSVGCWLTWLDHLLHLSSRAYCIFKSIITPNKILPFFLYVMIGRQGDRWNLCSNDFATIEFCKDKVSILGIFFFENHYYDIKLFTPRFKFQN